MATKTIVYQVGFHIWSGQWVKVKNCSTEENAIEYAKAMGITSPISYKFDSVGEYKVYKITSEWVDIDG